MTAKDNVWFASEYQSEVSEISAFDNSQLGVNNPRAKRMEIDIPYEEDKKEDVLPPLDELT